MPHSDPEVSSSASFFVRMMALSKRQTSMPALIIGVAIFLFFTFPHLVKAQTSTAASSSLRGTIKTLSANALLLSTDTGKDVSVTFGDNVRVLQIAPGSTDLKAATIIQMTDVAVGDRVLVTAKAGDTPEALTASRLILMKSTDIAQKHAAEQADWQKRGSGGLVSGVDASSGTITVSNGAKKTEIGTSDKTIYRRYAGDSVKFEDAQAGTMAQIQPGDQVRVRGAKSPDGSSILAEEIVSGSFRNISGTIASIDAAAGTATVKDLATKKSVVVKVTANSDLRKLPPEAAARFAARARAGQGGADAAKPGGAGPPTTSAGVPTASAVADGGHRPGAAGPGAAGPGASGAGGPDPRGPYPSGPDARGAGPEGAGGAIGSGGRSAGMDLSQMLTHLPQSTLAELKPGDALMIVASQTQPGAASLTAVTMLSGVEPILAATPSGSPAMSLSPWSSGGGMESAGGAAAP